MRKTIVHVAASADGFLARPDGDVAWLSCVDPAGDHGMLAFYDSIDTILWGRKTYEFALRMQAEGVPGGGFDPNLRHFVFSRRRPRALPDAVEHVTDPVAVFAERHRATPGKHTWLIGGAGLIASFLDAGAVDEFVVNVIPVFIGEGIPLVAPRHRTVSLRLHATQPFADGVVQLHYLIDREPPPRRHRKK